MQHSMSHTILRICVLFGLSLVGAFNGQPSLPAFGLHHQRPQLSQNQGSATELTARRPLSPPPPAFAPRTQTPPPPPPRISPRRRAAVRRADVCTVPTALCGCAAPGRHGPVQLAVHTHDLHCTLQLEHTLLLLAKPGAHKPLMASSSTSNLKSAFGGITPPAPRVP